MLKKIVLSTVLVSSIIMFGGSVASADFAGATIRVYIDKKASNSTILSNYVADSIQDSLLLSIARLVKDEIKDSLSSQNIRFPIYLPEIDDLSALDTLLPDHSLTLALIFDDDGFISIRARLNKSDFPDAVEDAKIKIRTASALTVSRSRESAAGLIARELVPIVTRWIVDSIYKVRVIITDFIAEDTAETNHFLTSGLANMVRTELTRSQAFIVYANDIADTQESGHDVPIFANYILSGSFFSYQSGIRVDMLCRSTKSQRILLSQSIVLDTLALHVLSDRVAQASSRMKSAMLADFQQSQVVIAVVASPPRRYFVGRRGLDNLRDIARIFRHNIVNKLRALVKPRGLQKDSKRVHIMEDTEYFDIFLDSSFAPGEILSELSADYLILVGIEDIGQGIHSVSTLYSYVTDPPIIGEPIYDGSHNKAKFRYLLDETILSIYSRLCELSVIPDPDTYLPTNLRERVISGSASSDEIAEAMDRLEEDMEGARVQDIRPNKGIGFRIGGNIHKDKELFLGKKSTEYLELFYAIRLPDRRSFPSWLATEFEVSLGLDYGQGTLFRHRTTGLNLMLTTRLLITALQYSDLPILYGVGVGLGIGGISYKYDANEAPYAGECRFDDAEVRGLYSVSFKVELPIVDWLRLQIAPRYIGQFGPNITCFENVPFDDSVLSPPRGELTGWCMIGGLRIVMR